jgi:tartrate-resistant acid phosphatase type 5
MWDWIEKTLSESDDFDYLFVTGHYQVLDIRGYYDANLVHNLLPLMKKYNVSAYVQGHRHTMEHNQGL